MQSWPIIGSLIQRAPLFSLETPLSSVVTEEKEERKGRGGNLVFLFLSISLCNYHLMFFSDLKKPVSSVVLSSLSIEEMYCSLK